MEYFGIDLHSKHSTLFGFDDVGEVTCEERVPTTQHGLEGVFGGRARCRIVVECSEQSAWTARVLEEMGHEVIVLNSRRVRLIAESTLKCDRIDAQILARLARLDDAFLRPVYQRSEGARQLRTRLRVRS
jgi:transposase